MAVQPRCGSIHEILDAERVPVTENTDQRSRCLSRVLEPGVGETANFVISIILVSSNCNGQIALGKDGI
jgi:hypothetical protein